MRKQIHHIFCRFYNCNIRERNYSRKANVFLYGSLGLEGLISESRPENVRCGASDVGSGRIFYFGKP
jgi:hypothetical protein